jgi:RNA polymerase sigma-70 factor (ECF subfamily)
MDEKGSGHGYTTRGTLLLRLNTAEASRRELAWTEFRDRYAPVIAGMASKAGARSQEIDDIIQDVLLGFYSQTPKFVYDPTKGRFRGYLKVCTIRAARRRLGQNAKFQSIPIERLGADDAEADQVWNQLWAAELLQRAVAAVRNAYHNNNTFQAFERCVLKDRPAESVAAELGIAPNSVYKAKGRILRAIREHLELLERDAG